MSNLSVHSAALNRESSPPSPPADQIAPLTPAPPRPGQDGLLRSLLAQDPNLLNAKDVVSHLSSPSPRSADSSFLTGWAHSPPLGRHL